ncbi:MAG: hypothetical protein K940chlam7_00567 [Chlamydiae bacterium]|nr:hypothetical protein [Chlamydiota bacterium]
MGITSSSIRTLGQKNPQQTGKLVKGALQQKPFLGILTSALTGVRPDGTLISSKAVSAKTAPAKQGSLKSKKQQSVKIPTTSDRAPGLTSGSSNQRRASLLRGLDSDKKLNRLG